MARASTAPVYGHGFDPHKFSHIYGDGNFNRLNTYGLEDNRANGF